MNNIKFSKIFWPAMTAVVAGMVISAAVWFCIGASILSAFNVETIKVDHDSVLVIDLAEDIADSPRISALGSFDSQTMSFSSPVTLLEVLGAIEYAAGDDRIAGICINPSGSGGVSAATLEELRDAIERFKLSGKFVVAYNDSYTQGEYYLASVADAVYIEPQGELDWRGLAVEMPFFRGLMDRLNIRAEVFRPTACRYKSAVEPYVMTRMSDENRMQNKALIESMWRTIVDDVARSRNLTAAELNAAADKLSAVMPADAVRLGLIDDMIYEDEMEVVYDCLGVKAGRDGLHNKISLGTYISTLAAGGKPSRNTITVIYADGQIVDGDMEADDYVFGTTLAGKLRTARLDEHTKAVVLRVNSPGGSALASDVVWREMELLRESKPVVVSMGAYAASGGYYISAPADVILADRLTVTGSIGVYGIMFNIGNALSSKLGITFDGVATSPAANMSMLHELNATQRAAITKGVDKVYDTFTRLVADGRNLPLDKVLEIAGGRVYSGSDAVEIGLADANGGLSEAIAVAADKAGIADDFTIYEFRTPPSELEMLIDLFTSQMASSGSLGRLSQSQFAALRQLIEEHTFIATDNGIQTLMPQRLDFMQR